MSLMGKMSAYIMGSVNFCAEGGMYEKLINIMLENKIPVSKIRATPTGFSAKVPSRYYKGLHRYARACKCRLYIKKKTGAFFSLYSLRRRYGILAGAVCFFILTLLMPRLVWTVDYYDIPSLEQNALGKHMYAAGIYPGMLQDNEKIISAQQQVLIAAPEYSWLAFNFVRGKIVAEAEAAVPKPHIIDNSPTYIIAGETGIIKEIQVYEGTGLKTAGQSVAKGELLVTGAQQSGLMITNTRSRAKIIAYVEKSYTTCVSLRYTAVAPTGKISEYKTLEFMGLSLPLYASAEQNANDIVNEYYTPLEINGFALPATVKVLQVAECAEKKINLTERQAKIYAEAALEKALYSDLTDVKVITKNIDYTLDNGVLTATMHITATADIAVVVEQ